MTEFTKISGLVADEPQTMILLNRGYAPEQRFAGQWFEIEPAMYDYFLGILPPKHFTGAAFVMCEPATDTLSDAFIKHRGRAFCLAVTHTNQMAFCETVKAFSAVIDQSADTQVSA